jgi:hypothetical protein
MKSISFKPLNNYKSLSIYIFGLINYNNDLFKKNILFSVEEMIIFNIIKFLII